MSFEEAVAYDTERSITEVEQPPARAMIPGICVIISKLITVFAVAIIILLPNSPTIWSWKLLVFIVVGFICVEIANVITGGIINLLASMLPHDVV